MSHSESTFMATMNRSESSFSFRYLEEIPFNREQMKAAFANNETAIDLFCSALKSSKGREFLFKTYHINALILVGEQTANKWARKAIELIKAHVDKAEASALEKTYLETIR